VLLSGRVVDRTGDGRRATLVSGLPNPISTSSPALETGFLRVLGENRKGRGEMGVRGEEKGDVAWEEEVEEAAVLVGL